MLRHDSYSLLFHCCFNGRPCLLCVIIFFAACHAFRLCSDGCAIPSSRSRSSSSVSTAAETATTTSGTNTPHGPMGLFRRPQFSESGWRVLALELLQQHGSRSAGRLHAWSSGKEPIWLAIQSMMHAQLLIARARWAGRGSGVEFQQTIMRMHVYVRVHYS